MTQYDDEFKEFQALAAKRHVLQRKIERKEAAILKHQEEIDSMMREQAQCLVGMRKVQPDLFEGIDAQAA